MASAPGVEVEGLDVLRRNLKAVDKDLLKGLRQVHLEISKPIAEEARGRAPHRSGRLAASVKARGTQKSASIAAGGARASYAPIIHYGWPGHNIEPQPFLTDTLADAIPGIADQYEPLLMNWIDSVWKDS